MRRKTPETQGLKMAKENEYYKKWLALQPKVDDRSVLRQDLHKQKMPDVRGDSLRKALQTLQEYGLKIKVNGSGRVVAQKPVPGALLQGVEECRLELRFEH